MPSLDGYGESERLAPVTPSSVSSTLMVPTLTSIVYERSASATSVHGTGIGDNIFRRDEDGRDASDRLKSGPHLETGSLSQSSPDVFRAIRAATDQVPLTNGYTAPPGRESSITNPVPVDRNLTGMAPVHVEHSSARDGRNLPKDFVGRARDDATAPLDMMARSYSPILGRFIGADPLFRGNRYAYARNDSLGLVDPLGLQEKKKAKARSQAYPPDEAACKAAGACRAGNDFGDATLHSMMDQGPGKDAGRCIDTKHGGNRAEIRPRRPALDPTTGGASGSTGRTPTSSTIPATPPLQDPKVQEALRRAWKESNPGPGADPTRQEQGGDIVANSDGTYTVIRYASDASNSIAWPVTAPRGRVVSFHTHPNTDDSWEQRPGKSDLLFLANHTARMTPHYVISDVGIYGVDGSGNVAWLGFRDYVLGH